MAMDKKHRTWICSVLFTDIVSYTKFDVEEQMEIRSHFYDLVDQELSNYNSDDFITLDAGDGMAICYLGDPEDLLLMALSLRDEFIKITEQEHIIDYKVRLGINLGPVKIAELQGEKRVIGDAINVANRIMGFAGPNELYVSRSYYEVVSHVSKEYFNMFDFIGTREDKHVRKHHVYAVGGNEQQTPATPVAPTTQETEAVPTVAEPTPAPSTPSKPTFSETILKELEQLLSEHIGPMAGLLVKKKSKKATDLTQLCVALASEIEETENRDAFIKASKKLI